MKGRGYVTSIEGNRARVKVIAGSECVGCPSHGHCHADDIKEHEITVINDFGSKVSDLVVFEADTGKAIISAALVWILPIISMFVGYGVAQRFAGGAWPILGAFVFLVASYFILKQIDNIISGGTIFYPKITGRASTSEIADRGCQDTK